MVFGGGILGGARKIWGNPYLNSTTVLFDISLEMVNVSQNWLETSGCIKLCRALTHLYSLKVLNISNNGIKSVGAHEIAHALQRKQQLEVVNVSWNKFENNLATILTSLKCTKVLKKLILQHSGTLSYAAVNELCQLIHENSSLEVLDLGSTKLQNPDAYKIFRALENNTSLKILYVCHNNVGDSALEQLSLSLTEKCTVRDLRLHGNPLSDLAVKNCVYNNFKSFKAD